jgi:hypothetical protein
MGPWFPVAAIEFGDTAADLVPFRAARAWFATHCSF